MEIKVCDMYMLKLSERVEALEEEINKNADESEIGKLQAQIKELEEASLAKQTDLEVKMQDALTDRRNAQDEIESRRSNLYTEQKTIQS